MTYRSPRSSSGQQIDALAEVGDDLPPDLEEIVQAKNVESLLDDLLQALLGCDRVRTHLLCRLPVQPPEPELDWHRQRVYFVGSERSR